MSGAWCTYHALRWRLASAAQQLIILVHLIDAGLNPDQHVPEAPEILLALAGSR